jgi:hypothetical protein
MKSALVLRVQPVFKPGLPRFAKTIAGQTAACATCRLGSGTSLDLHFTAIARAPGRRKSGLYK